MKAIINVTVRNREHDIHLAREINLRFPLQKGDAFTFVCDGKPLKTSKINQVISVHDPETGEQNCIHYYLDNVEDQDIFAWNFVKYRSDMRFSVNSNSSR